ncbi:hypothetical protein Ancab_004672, partial [Ancistrocladus abbreviatus]
VQNKLVAVQLMSNGVEVMLFVKNGAASVMDVVAAAGQEGGEEREEEGGGGKRRKKKKKKGGRRIELRLLFLGEWMRRGY